MKRRRSLWFVAGFLAALMIAATLTIYTIPSNDANFLSNLQDFLRGEIGEHNYARFAGVVLYGGWHTDPGATLTATIPATVAFPDGYYTPEDSVSHTYTASKDTYVLIRADNTVAVAVGGASISYAGTSNLYVFVEMANASTEPTTPDGTLKMMKVVTDGAEITSVVDYRGGEVAVEGIMELSAQTFDTVMGSEAYVGNRTIRISDRHVTAGAITVPDSTVIVAGSYQVFIDTAGAITFGSAQQEILPEWWGAVGDGTTDDTTELQSALTTGVSVELTGGDYLISAVDMLTDKQRLFSTVASKISVSNTADVGITIGSAGAYVNDVIIEGITFEVDGGTPTAFIQNRKGLMNTIRHCVFDGQTIDYCIDNYIGYRLNIDHCSFHTVAVTSAVYFRYANDSSYWSASNSITNCDFTNVTTGRAVEIEGGGNHAIRDSNIESCDGDGGILLDTAGNKRIPNILIDTVLFEQNDGGYDIMIDDDATNFVYNLTIINSKFTNTDAILEATIDLGSYSQATFVGCVSDESSKLVITGDAAQAQATFIGCNGDLSGGNFYTHSPTVRVREFGAGATDVVKILDSTGVEVFAIDEDGVVNLDSIEDAFVHEKRVIFTDADTTPSVSGGNVFTFDNSGATVVTDFDDGTDGQVIWINFNEANTDIDFTGTNLEGNGGADWTTPEQLDAMSCHHNGTKWFCDVSDNTP